MSSKLLLSLLFFISFQVQAFILIDPDYRLSNPESVRIGIVREGCTGNNISNADLVEYLEEAVDSYWNTVGDSVLHIKVEEEIALGSDGEPPAGTIIVYCESLSNGILGVANINTNKDGCRVRMSSGYDGASLNYDSFISTLVHEIGHCVGLHHSNDSASVMTYNATAFSIPSTLSRDDKDGVTYLYPYESKGEIFGSCNVLASTGGSRTSKGFLSLLLSFILTLGIAKLLKMGTNLF